MNYILVSGTLFVVSFMLLIVANEALKSKKRYNEYKSLAKESQFECSEVRIDEHV